MTELIVMVVLTLLTVVLFETHTLAAGQLTGDASRQFLVTLTMELVTVCFIPLALYLFKIGFVSKALKTEGEGKAGKLLLWGSVRMMTLCLPMLLNTVCYYLFGFQVSFGYMAIILFLCLFMVYPSIDRCVSETSVS